MSDQEARPQQDFDFQFIISGGNQVTGMQVVLGDHSWDVHLPSNAVFTVGTGAVTETLSNTDVTKTITFTQEAGSSLYDKSEVLVTFAHPSTAEDGYSFTTDANNAITGIQKTETEIEDGQTQTQTEAVHVPPDTIFSTGTDGSVVEQYVKGDEVVTTTYVQPQGSTLYAIGLVDKVFIDPGSATTYLDVKPSQRMEFTIDSSGDVTQPETLSRDGTLHAFSNPNATFTQLAPGYVEEVVTDGSHTSFAVFYAGDHANGVYTQIAHGSGAAVDLAGLQAQVAQIPQAVGWIL